METPDTQKVVWAYPNFSMIWEHAIGIGRGPEAREHGVAFVGEYGTLVVDRGGWESTRRRTASTSASASTRSPAFSAGRGAGGLPLEARRELPRVHEVPRASAGPNVEIGHDSMMRATLATWRSGSGAGQVEPGEGDGGRRPEARELVSRPYRRRGRFRGSAAPRRHRESPASRRHVSLRSAGCQAQDHHRVIRVPRGVAESQEQRVSLLLKTPCSVTQQGRPLHARGQLRARTTLVGPFKDVDEHWSLPRRHAPLAGGTGPAGGIDRRAVLSEPLAISLRRVVNSGWIRPLGIGPTFESRLAS